MVVEKDDIAAESISIWEEMKYILIFIQIKN